MEPALEQTRAKSAVHADLLFEDDTQHPVNVTFLSWSVGQALQRRPHASRR